MKIADAATFRHSSIVGRAVKRYTGGDTLICLTPAAILVTVNNYTCEKADIILFRSELAGERLYVW